MFSWSMLGVKPSLTCYSSMVPNQIQVLLWNDDHLFQQQNTHPSAPRFPEFSCLLHHFKNIWHFPPCDIPRILPFQDRKLERRTDFLETTHSQIVPCRSFYCLELLDHCSHFAYTEYDIYSVRSIFILDSFSGYLKRNLVPAIKGPLLFKI